MLHYISTNEIDLDHTIKGDQVWLEAPNRIAFPFDKRIKELP